LRSWYVPDIFHDFPIKKSAHAVFQAISTAEGLDQWWTKRSSGQPALGAEYELWFGPEYDWRGRVTRCDPNTHFELLMHSAEPEWVGTRVGFTLEGGPATTQAHFYHTGWPDVSENYRGSSYCWAMYLRILKRYLEYGETVPYEKRLSV
jgi:uncharacterized protein YndB with AHSA1/START domain